MKKGDPTPATAGNSITAAPSEQEALFRIVSRLIKEKAAADKLYGALGFAKGRDYATKASYLDILYVAKGHWANIVGYGLSHEEVFGDPVLGKVFKEAFHNDKNLFLYDTSDGQTTFKIINDLAEIFISSFGYAVRQFWSEVEGYVKKRIRFPTEK
jgi:hypothetical protein